MKFPADVHSEKVPHEPIYQFKKWHSKLVAAFSE
jgi:hypothetical protein